MYALDKKPFRDVYAQFRVGFSELYQHRLRFSRENPENLFVCPSCTEEFECEFHFLYGCPVYEDIRQKFLYSIREFNRVERLFTVNDTYMIRSIAMFLYYAFKRRREAAEVDFAEM